MKNSTANINNVTNLWKLASESVNGYYENNQLCYGYKANLKWPNKIWLKNLISDEIITDLDHTMHTYPGITFSYFDHQDNISDKTLNTKFLLRSTQYGMSLPLTKHFEISRALDFRLVKNIEDATIWSTAFQEAFLYPIDSTVITHIKDHVFCYIIYFEENPVGTLMLYKTQKTMGIHCLGIVPDQRRKGFAKEIMHHALNKSIDKGARLATLQASEMAKNMYLTLGFTMNFLMKNYQIQ